MRKILLAALAATAILSGGMRGYEAEAMTRAASAALNVAAGHVGSVQRAVNVCGSRGCVPVQTKRVQHQRPGSVAAHHI